MFKRSSTPAIAAWCPSPHYGELVALGSTQVTFDSKSYETRTTLEIASINSFSPDDQLTTLGSISVKDKFTALAWSLKGIPTDLTTSTPNSTQYPQGIIAGGMSDGTLNFFDSHAILSSSSSQPLDPLLSKQQGIHAGEISSINFHPKLTNLVATGGVDGEVFMWDLANMSSIKAVRPNTTKPGTPIQGPRSTAITDVQWSSFLAKFLTTGNVSGETTIYDLHQKRSILTFRPHHNSTQPASLRVNTAVAGIQWGSDVELAIAYNSLPIVEIWDFRYQQRPILKLDVPSYSPVSTQTNLLGMLQQGQLQHGVTSLLWDTNDRSITVADTYGFLHFYDMTNPDFQLHSTSTKSSRPSARPIIYPQQQPPLSYPYQPIITTTQAPPNAQGLVTNLRLNHNKDAVYAYADDASIAIATAPRSSLASSATLHDKTVIKQSYTLPPAPQSPTNAPGTPQNQQPLPTLPYKISATPGIAFGFGGLQISWGREKTFTCNDNDTETKQILQTLHKQLCITTNAQADTLSTPINKNDTNQETGLPNDVILPPNPMDFPTLILQRLHQLFVSFGLIQSQTLTGETDVNAHYNNSSSNVSGSQIDFNEVVNTSSNLRFDENYDQTDIQYHSLIELRVLQIISNALQSNTPQNDSNMTQSLQDQFFFELTTLFGLSTPPAILQWQNDMQEYQNNHSTPVSNDFSNNNNNNNNNLVDSMNGLQLDNSSLPSQQQQFGHAIAPQSQNDQFSAQNQFTQQQQPNDDQSQNQQPYQFDFNTGNDFDPTAFNGEFNGFGNDSQPQQLQQEPIQQPHEQFSPQHQTSCTPEPILQQSPQPTSPQNVLPSTPKLAQKAPTPPERPIFSLSELICGGNLSLAADQCVHQEKDIEAIVISFIQDSLSTTNTLQSTSLNHTIRSIIQKYSTAIDPNITPSVNNFFFLTQTLLDRSFNELLATADFSTWRLIFGVIISYSIGQEREQLLSQFYSILQTLHNNPSINHTIPYSYRQFILVILSMITGATNDTVSLWKQRHQQIKRSNNCAIFTTSLSSFVEKSVILHFLIAQHPFITVSVTAIPTLLLQLFQQTAFSLLSRVSLFLTTQYATSVSNFVSAVCFSNKIQPYLAQVPELTTSLTNFQTFLHRLYVGVGQKNPNDNVPFAITRPTPTPGIKDRWNQILTERAQRQCEKEQRLAASQVVPTDIAAAGHFNQQVQPQQQINQQPSHPLPQQPIQHPTQHPIQQSIQQSIQPQQLTMAPYQPQTQPIPPNPSQLPHQPLSIPHQHQQQQPNLLQPTSQAPQQMGQPINCGPSANIPTPGLQSMPVPHIQPLSQPLSQPSQQAYQPPSKIPQQLLLPQAYQPSSAVQPYNPQSSQPQQQQSSPVNQAPYAPNETDIGMCQLFESFAQNLEQGCIGANFQSEMKQFSRIHKSLSDLSTAIKTGQIQPELKNEFISIASAISSADYTTALNINTNIATGPLNTSSTVQAWTISFKFLLNTTKKFQ